ncbi:photosynthetic protein synthase I [Oxalicibacterium flavum]|uniref:Photosynthetic protein synthase I n=1 Tax=Oxalicibacterium flavum TaxID=179467 RepID=A0A8J2UP62_9BURK|nr:SCO family protein [Oxalicibacterium flavum]GGB99405.1 photosynthetic protein synthase I [Oxalicibacterium flavum]
MQSFQEQETTRLRHFHYVTALLLLAVMLLAGCKKPEPPTSSIKLKGSLDSSFTLYDPAGKQVSLTDFRGKAVLLFFGFVQCPDVCPTALTRAAHVKQLLGADADRLQVIFVSVDPERDTPEILREYTAAFGKDFLGLTADAQTIRKTADAFGIYYTKVPTGSSYTMDHTTISYLYAPDGKIYAAITADSPAEEVARDVRNVLADGTS